MKTITNDGFTIANGGFITTNDGFYNNKQYLKRPDRWTPPGGQYGGHFRGHIWPFEAATVQHNSEFFKTMSWEVVLLSNFLQPPVKNNRR